MTSIDTDPVYLREMMVDDITGSREQRGLPRLSGLVVHAMGQVERHKFVPHATLREAYTASRAIDTKPGLPGAALARSCASAPGVVARMLDQLGVESGDNVLEIGAGTGYNAALLSRLAAPEGHVTTVDIHPDVTADARRNLDANGFAHVVVVTADGAEGEPKHAPYDRLIVTVGPWDIPKAWREQLATGGRMVVPLRWRGQARTVELVLEPNGVLVSRSEELCGFVPMEGPDQDGERSARIGPGGEIELTWDEDQAIDPDAIESNLADPHTAWSNTVLGPMDSIDGMWLRMTAAEPGTCRAIAGDDAVTAGLLPSVLIARVPALAHEGSLAVCTIQRRAEGGARVGATGYGPEGADLAERLCTQADVWDRDRDAKPVIRIYPAGFTPAGNGLVIPKRQSAVTVRY